MNTLAHKTALSLVAVFTLIGFSAAPAEASNPQVLLVAPNPGYDLPKFGFSSFNLGGVGDRVTFVRWGGLASQIGLEPGDIIVSMNGFPLSYHGAWNDALRQAVNNGGWVQLRVRDVRSGLLLTRQTFVGGSYGPVTPYVTTYGPETAHMVHTPQHVSHPVGPITMKSKVAPSNGTNGTSQTLKKIASRLE